MAKQKEVRVARKLSKHEAEINELKENVKTLKAEQKTLKESQNTFIADDLCAKKPGLNTPLFSYEEIAKRHGVSVSNVQKVAEKKGLRRKKDIKINK